MISLFVTFHKVIHDNLYQYLNKYQKQLLTFYGVRDRQIPDDTELDVIYEYDLPFYNPSLQKLRYNEGSTMYHVYHNDVFDDNRFIGFFQYDMKFDSSEINVIDNICKTETEPFVVAPFFATDYSKQTLGGSIQLIFEDLTGFGIPLDNYNKFFNTNHTKEDVLSQPFIMCNCFVVPVHLFKKLMCWMEQFFVNKIDSDQLIEIVVKNPGALEINSNIPNLDLINPGHLIEILTGMFFALEIKNGCKLYCICVSHMLHMKV